VKRRALVLSSALGLASFATVPRAAKSAQKGIHVHYPDIVPGVPLAFPRDHGAHPRFRTEWWYVTGWLETPEDAPLGFQVTFFRTRPDLQPGDPSAFAPNQLLFAHAALADPRVGHLIHVQRAVRAGMGLAGAREDDMQIFIGHWTLARETNGDQFTTHIESHEFDFDLRLVPTESILEEGVRGFSQKGPSPRQASRYYSLPQLDASGQIRRGGVTTPVRGRAWLDHEWSSAYLDARAVGWDWTGLNFDDGGALMAFRIRLASGASLWAGATWRHANGQIERFDAPQVEFRVQRFWRSSRTGIRYPIEQQLHVGVYIWRIVPLFDDQELDSQASTGTLYWEGAVRAKPDPTSSGLPANSAHLPAGRGYLELTGYDRALKL